MTFSVRRARREDLPNLLALFRELSPSDPILHELDALPVFAHLLEFPGLTLLVAELAGQVVGTVTVTVTPNLPHGAQPYAVIENVVTLSAHRHQGIARALMAEADRTARDAGAYKVMFQSGIARREAHEVYRRLGYSDTSKVAFERRP